MPRKERKWNHIKCSIKRQKEGGIQKLEQSTRIMSKEQPQISYLFIFNFILHMYHLF